MTDLEMGEQQTWNSMYMVSPGGVSQLDQFADPHADAINALTMSLDGKKLVSKIQLAHYCRCFDA